MGIVWMIMDLKLFLVGAILFLISALCAEAQTSVSPALDVRLGVDPFTLIQRDSTRARLPKLTQPDSILVKPSCSNFKMPIYNPSKKYQYSMPIIPPPDSLKFNMPIIGQDTTCGEGNIPRK
ncbi:MAG: hypothetical protein U5K69_26205 [Balneolaceae bacterium]|nr:hypothetical protein [Balneolaceae bacterium]